MYHGAPNSLAIHNYVVTLRLYLCCVVLCCVVLYLSTFISDSMVLRVTSLTYGHVCAQKDHACLCVGGGGVQVGGSSSVFQ